jgi:hypothetical protein
MGPKEEAVDAFVQLIVPLERDPGEDGPPAEWVWAEPLGTGRYRIESTPFFAYGLSCGDVVRAEPSAPGEPPEVSELERKAGVRTLRLALADPWSLGTPQVTRFLDGFVKMGCRCEELPPKLVALSIPEDVDVSPVVERLQGPYRDGLLIWEWADPIPS